VDGCKGLASRRALQLTLQYNALLLTNVSNDQITRVARVTVFAMVSIALPLRAQAPAPQATFPAGTDLVQVDVSVLDSKRHPVRGLKAEDFTI